MERDDVFIEASLPVLAALVGTIGTTQRSVQLRDHQRDSFCGDGC